MVFSSISLAQVVLCVKNSSKGAWRLACTERTLDSHMKKNPGAKQEKSVAPTVLCITVLGKVGNVSNVEALRFQRCLLRAGSHLYPGRNYMFYKYHLHPSRKPQAGSANQPTGSTSKTGEYLQQFYNTLVHISYFLWSILVITDLL
jgi:hypothetical protein